MTSGQTCSAAAPLRHDWSVDEIRDLFELPLLDLVAKAHEVHRQHHHAAIQLAGLLSIKTGGCAEDCKYCPQSAHYARSTGVAKQPLMALTDVLDRARAARDAGASRFCMGAAWREVRDGEEFDRVLAMIRGVRGLGMEACVTLGMLNPDQAEKLAQAGLTAYNHNLDTSPEHYGNIITTRTYEDRINTLKAVRDAGISVCCGGIIGLGEGSQDRAAMMQVLATMSPHPESVPINALVAVKGTPLEDESPVDSFDFIRMVAVARILMPRSCVRLSAGRQRLSKEAQAMCFMAGANSIFYGEKLLVTENNDARDDAALIENLGLKITEPNQTTLLPGYENPSEMASVPMPAPRSLGAMELGKPA